MKCYTEFDKLQEAFSKVKLDEEVMPYRYGMLVENEDSYCKMQKLLNSGDMSHCHRYLLDLDPENLDECDIEKIDKLFDLGVKRGFIDNSFNDELAAEEAAETPDVVEPDLEPKQPKVQIPCWTVLYSCTDRNGNQKCGECYSNAISVQACKADAIAKLSRFGYENIAILAVEACDCDMSGFDDCECGQMNESNKNPYAAGITVSDCNKTTTSGGSKKKSASKKRKAVREDDEDQAKSDNSEDTSSETSDNTSSEETSDTETSDTETSDTETSDTETSDTETSDTETSDTETSDTETSDTETSDEKTSDEETSDTETSDTETSDTETSDEETSDEDDKEELSDEKKSELKDEYKRVFKQTMLNCKFEGRAFNTLTIEEKVKFFKALLKDWTKNEPTEFMSDEEIDQLESVEMKQ